MTKKQTTVSSLILSEFFSSFLQVIKSLGHRVWLGSRVTFREKKNVTSDRFALGLSQSFGYIGPDHF